MALTSAPDEPKALEIQLPRFAVQRKPGEGGLEPEPMSEPTAGGTNSGTTDDESPPEKHSDDSTMNTLFVRCPPRLEESIDEAVEEGRYASRSAAMRDALRNQFLRGGA